MMKTKTILIFISFCFIAINIATRRSGGTNPASRYAHLCAMATRGTFEITGAESMTLDWAQTPDGRFFSNKAPGAAFAALPFFWTLHQIDLFKNGFKGDSFTLCKESSITARLFLLSMLLQVCGSLLVLFFACQYFAAVGVSKNGQIVFATTFLFSTTASCYMNTFFGHGLAAVFLSGALLAALRQRLALSAFLWGWALLTDYAVLWSFFGFALLWLMSSNSIGESFRRGIRIAIGSLLPAFLWIWYHTSSFGSPFALPNKFQNPQFVEKSDYALWGVLSLFPNPKYLFELTFGMSRGLAWTQPWILAMLIASPILIFQFRDRLSKNAMLVGILATTALIGALIMNASFNGWHGGLSAGPRYLAPILPLFCFWLAMIWDQMKSVTKIFFGITIMISALFTCLALIHGILMDERPLWLHFF